MLKITLQVLILASVLLCACIKEIDFDGHTATSQVVVNGFLAPRTDSLHLSRTFGLNEQTPEAIQDAQVNIVQTGQNKRYEFPFEEAFTMSTTSSTLTTSILTRKTGKPSFSNYLCSPFFLPYR